MVRNADSRKMAEKYHTTELMRVARRVQGYWSREAQRKRKEKIGYVLSRREEQYRALCGAG